MLYSIDTAEEAAESDRGAIDAGITEFNAQQPELTQVRPLCAFARDENAQVIAGVVGRTWGLCAEAQQVWVSERLRGKGLGRKVLAAFERASAERGCSLVYLDTFTFQAPGFYEKLGYQAALVTGGYAPGISKFTMHKVLNPTASEA